MFNGLFDDRIKSNYRFNRRAPDERARAVAVPRALGQHRRPRLGTHRRRNSLPSRGLSLTNPALKWAEIWSSLVKGDTALAHQSITYGIMPCMCCIIYFCFVKNTTSYHLVRYCLHLLKNSKAEMFRNSFW